MPINGELKRIIADIKIETGLKQAEIADKLGVKSTYLSDMINGRVPFSENIKALISEKFQTKDMGKNDIKNDKEGNLIPFYDDVTSVGGANETSASVDNISHPSDYIDTGDWFRDATAAIRHYGESMIEYPTGCILALKEVEDRELIIPGRDYMVETSEYRVTKRIQKGKDAGYITAYSTNPETYPDGRLIHEPFDIPWRAIRHIALVLGYVVKKNGGTMVFSNKK